MYWPFIIVTATLLTGLSCSEPASNQTGSRPVTKLPAFIKDYQLVLPGARAYQAGEHVVFKTTESKDRVAGFYRQRLGELDFSTVLDMNQQPARLLQFQRKAEIISVEITGLSHRPENLVKLSHSRVKTVPGTGS